jgi:hypothetical protein
VGGWGAAGGTRAAGADRQPRRGWRGRCGLWAAPSAKRRCSNSCRLGRPTRAGSRCPGALGQRQAPTRDVKVHHVQAAALHHRHLDRAHLVGGQRARLVRADDGGAAQRLHGRQRAHLQRAPQAARPASSAGHRRPTAGGPANALLHAMGGKCAAAPRHPGTPAGGGKGWGGTGRLGGEYRGWSEVQGAGGGGEGGSSQRSRGPHNGVLLCHAARAQRQAGGDHGGQALGDGGHGQRHRDLEVVERAGGPAAQRRVAEAVDVDHLCGKGGGGGWRRWCGVCVWGVGGAGWD